jgi:hypothetical protein
VRVDQFLSLADSKDVALVISLVGNFMLGWWLTKIYKAKERLHGTMNEILRMLVPFAIRRKHDKD